MTKLLDDAIEKVKALPEPDQDLAAELLLGFADGQRERYQLSPEQVQDVELAKQEAREGKFAADSEMKSVWQRFGL
jgi:hypothetical protein